MNRKYMDDQYLKILQGVNEEETKKIGKEALAKEIAAQDIGSGQIDVYGNTMTFAPRTYLDSKIIITMPEEWCDMAPDVVKTKYPYELRPPIILTDAATTINFTINHLEQALKIEELVTFKNTMRNFVDRMTKAQFVEEGIIQAENIGFTRSWFDFTVMGIDDELYNLIFFISLNRRALLITFNCLNKDQERWKPIVFDMLKTLQSNELNVTRYARRENSDDEIHRIGK